MVQLYLILGLLIPALIAYAVANTTNVRKVVSKAATKSHFPKAVTALFLVAQISEITRVIAHVDTLHLIAAVFIFTMLVASKSGIDLDSET